MPGAGARSRPDRAGPRFPDRWPGRTCGGPSRRASGGPSPAGETPAPGERSSFSERGNGLLVQEFLEVVADDAEVLVIGRRRISLGRGSLRSSSKRTLAQFARACQVHSEGSASEGRFSSMAWRIVSWSWRSAFACGRSPRASSKLAPLMSRAVSSTPSRCPTHSAKLAGAVVVGQKPAWRRPDLAVDHLEDHFLGRGALEQALAERVDALALLVHHLVVFQQILADIEVALLRPFSAPPRCAG